jgi:adenine specific DNA methylase Mod
MATIDWNGKQEVLNYFNNLPSYSLKDKLDLSFGKADSKNILIEGDNLIVLKALLPQYEGKVKCIYLDPPFNTGKYWWAYNDRMDSSHFEEKLKKLGLNPKDLSRQDKWLCMMYPRLLLLNEFLTKDGSIWISIDDHELHSLRLVMDEIFGAENFITTIIWQKSYAVKSCAKHFSKDHEYIVVYARNGKTWRPNLLPRTEGQNAVYKNPDNDPRGPWRGNNLSARNYWQQGIYSIQCPGGRIIEGPPKGSTWRVAEEKFWELNKNGRIYWGRNNNRIPLIKIFLTEVKKGRVPQTLWTWEEVGNTADAKRELFEACPMDDPAACLITPKPVRLMRRILSLATDKNSWVLDAFAGSGTTGQAVWGMNQEDGGKRKIILIERERNICEKITVERLKNVAQEKNNYRDLKYHTLAL